MIPDGTCYPQNRTLLVAYQSWGIYYTSSPRDSKVSSNRKRLHPTADFFEPLSDRGCLDSVRDPTGVCLLGQILRSHSPPTQVPGFVLRPNSRDHVFLVFLRYIHHIEVTAFVFVA